MPAFSKLHMKSILKNILSDAFWSHTCTQNKCQLYLLLIILVSLLNVSNSSYTLYTPTHTECIEKNRFHSYFSSWVYCSQDYCLNISSNSSHTQDESNQTKYTKYKLHLFFNGISCLYVCQMITRPFSHHRHRQGKFWMSIESHYLWNMQVHWCTHTHTYQHTCIPTHSHLHTHLHNLSILYWPSGPSRTWACL